MNDLGVMIAESMAMDTAYQMGSGPALKGGVVGAGLGAGAGFLYSKIRNRKKIEELKYQMAECPDEQCRLKIKAQIDALNSQIYKAMAIGAGAGGLGGAAAMGANPAIQGYRAGRQVDQITSGVQGAVDRGTAAVQDGVDRVKGMFGGR